MARSPSLGETSQLAIPAKELDDGIPEPPEPGAAKSEVRSKATGSFDARSFSNRSVGLFDGIRSWSKPSSFQVGGLGLGPREGVSSDFMGLVEKLVHQHQTEMAMCGKKKSFDIPPVTTEWERLCSAGSRFSKRSQEPGQAFSPAAVLMRERKHDLKELDASKLLEAFDEHALQEVSEESWSPAMIATRITSFRKHQWDELKETGCCTKLENFLQSNWYEFFIAFVLGMNALWMAFELQVTGREKGYLLGIYPSGIQNLDHWLEAFLLGDRIFAYLFVTDVLVRIIVLRSKFFRMCLNYVDIAVSMTAMAEVILSGTLLGDLPVNPLLFKLLRIGKLARAIRMISMTTMLLPLQLLIKCLTASRGMLFWSFCLLSFVQCVAGMTLSTLCQDFLVDENADPVIKEEVYRYYGTFTRTVLSMFEILFANWGPACRVLVDNVSEWFSLFFLAYRCVLGFAVLNVVNSVFVQQTMKTASSDELRHVFQTMDTGGDGTINYEEFSKLVSNPKLKFWMSQLELEYHDLMSLFEFLDNGDGEITLSEFIEGATKLRGQAKALDIWRMETKLEVLFEEVLQLLSVTSGPNGPSSAVPDEPPPDEDEQTESKPVLKRMASQSVEEVFAASAYKHIRSTKGTRLTDDEKLDI
ncbi:unnamed protein product [Durusdinium trenchii]|uniref:EF-hand domain-containing protein n=1 Tax=Durusdinium trenchii TaxID=1381693 RepID=A0ABP0MQX9_9DINO